MAEISLDEESQLVFQLCETLEREQRSLVDLNIGQIELFIEEKAKLLHMLAQYSQNRYKLLASAGMQANESGMIDWLKQRKNSPINAVWLVMQQMLQKTKELNRVNGLLINKHFNRNQQSLNVLQGKPTTSHLYGPNGYATSGIGLRHSITS